MTGLICPTWKSELYQCFPSSWWERKCRKIIMPYWQAHHIHWHFHNRKGGDFFSAGPFVWNQYNVTQNANLTNYSWKRYLLSKQPHHEIWIVDLSHTNERFILCNVLHVQVDNSWDCFHERFYQYVCIYNFHAKWISLPQFKIHVWTYPSSAPPPEFNTSSQIKIAHIRPHPRKNCNIISECTILLVSY